MAAIDHSVRYRRRIAAMRLSLSRSLCLSNVAFSSFMLPVESLISPSYALSKTTRPPSFCARLWTLSEAYAVSGIASGLIEKAVRRGELELMRTAQGNRLNAEEFRQWAYSTKPQVTGKRRFSLMQTSRLLGLQAELVSAMEKAHDYAEQIDFSLPDDWIGRLIAEIHDRERANRMAVEESLKAMGYK